MKIRYFFYEKRLYNDHTSGIHMLNWVFSNGPLAPEISNSGIVLPKAFGFCSETIMGTFKSFNAFICG